MTSNRNYARLGAVDTIVKLDIQSIHKDQSAANGQGYAYYAGANVNENHDAVEKDVLFSLLTGVRHKDKESHVRASLNGQGREEFQLYKNLPEGVREEYIKDALKAKMNYAGIAVTHFEKVDAEHANSGFVASWAGLNTLPCYVNTSVGDVLVADLPDKDFLTGLKNGEFRRKGVPGTKFPLITKPLDPRSAGNKLRRTMLDCLTRAAVFQKAMGGKTKKHTRGMVNTCGRIMKSDLFTAVMVNYVMDKNGYTAADGTTKIASIGEEAAFTNAKNMAKALGLLGTRQTPDQRRLQHAIASHLYTDGTAKQFRIGGDEGVHESSKKVNVSTDAGQLLNLQLNHFQAKITAFHQAILDEERFIIGKVTRGGTKGGTQDVVQGIGKS